MAIIQRTANGRPTGSLIVRVTDYDPRTGKPRRRQKDAGCRDQAIAKQIEARLKEQARRHKAEADQWAELRRKGLSDHVTEKLADHGRKALADHLADYRTMLEGKGRTVHYVDHTIRVCRQAFAACGFQTPGDIDPVKVSAYLSDLTDARPVPQRDSRNWKARTIRRRRDGLSARSINRRLTALKGFTAWMLKNERIRTDPLKQIPKRNIKADRRRRRRALEDPELAALLAAAEAGPDYRGMTGHDRAMLYRVAVGTGLRASELASITPESFDLADPARASVIVEAAYTKNGEQADQPITPDLAAAVAEYLKARTRGEPVWRIPTRTATMLRRDLAAAREKWLAAAPTPRQQDERERSGHLTAEDPSGRVVDFHALRHTFITRLARSGALPAVAMKLARHSSITLTMDFYTHILVTDERAALAQLPAIETPPAGQELPATGTENRRPRNGLK